MLRNLIRRWLGIDEHAELLLLHQSLHEQTGTALHRHANELQLHTGQIARLQGTPIAKIVPTSRPTP